MEQYIYELGLYQTTDHLCIYHMIYMYYNECILVSNNISTKRKQNLKKQTKKTTKNTKPQNVYMSMFSICQSQVRQG